MLSNTFVQILIGCAPFLLLFLGLSIFSKKHRIRNICLTAFVALVAAGGILLTGGDKEELTPTAPMADNMRFAYSLMDEGSYDLAAEVIKSGRASSTYSQEETLALARVSALQGKPQAAASLYRKLPQNDEQNKAVAAAGGDPAAVEILNQHIVGEIEEYLSDNKSEDYDRAAQAAAFADSQYASYLSGGEIDLEAAEKECKKIINLSEDTPELLRIAQLRIARMKLQLMLEDYEGIAECVDDYSDYNELLVVSELYMNGYIDAKDFSDEYRKADEESYRVVADTLQDVYSDYYSDKSREERKEAKEQISALKALIKNPALIKVQKGLLEYAESDFAYDKSKVYLQLAKTENYMGNIAKSNEYVDKSLNTVGDCSDEEYTAPMYRIIGIIADKDDPERLKDVAAYTDRILTNTMTVQMSDKLKAPVAEETSETGEAPEDDTQSEKLDFSAQFNTYVSTKRMAVNITSVQADGDTINANINFSGDLDYSLSEIKEVLQVSDCGASIEKFTLEKVEYKASNILMCCDVSGSMTNQAVRDLKEALTDFVNTTDEKESVALVLFSGSIEDVSTFGAPSEELMETINNIDNSGGTDIYKAVCESISHFTKDVDTINTIILMSDGDDSTPNEEKLSENVIKPCDEMGITIYSVGLTPSVNSNLLTKYASCTGGSYVYAADSSQISAFFDSLRAQTLNSYRLSYTVPDTLQNTRNLRVSLNGESYTYDEQWYTLDGSPVDEQAIENSLLFLENKAVYGFDEKLLFKSERSRVLNLHGSGFAEDNGFTIGLSGCVNYNNLAWEYVDETTLRVTIPAGIACDSYDVTIALNGRQIALNDGLTVVVQGSEKTTVFGDYVFTSYFKETTEDGVILGQYVTMNGWLNFKGDVQLRGDLSSDRIYLYTSEGAYVHYDSDTEGSIAGAYAGRDAVIPLNGEFALYSYKEDSRESERLDKFTLSGLCRLYDVYTVIYPEKLTVSSDEITLIMPYLNDVLSCSSDLYSFRTDVIGEIGADYINLTAEYDNLDEDDRPKRNKAASLGNLPIFTNTDCREFSLDSNGIYLGYTATLPFISDENAFDLAIYGDWDGRVNLADVQLSSAYDVALTGVGADVKMCGLKLGLKQNSDKYVLVGGYTMTSQTLAEMFPGIEQYLGNMAESELVSCRKSELILPLGEHYITAKSDITMMNHINLRNVLMELGRSDYTNKLLGMDDDSVYGFMGATNSVVGIHNENCDIDIDGKIDVHITDSFIGITAEGELSFDADWWSATEKLSGQGTAVIGVQRTHDGDYEFITKAESGGKTFYIAWNGQRGDYYGSTQL